MLEDIITRNNVQVLGNGTTTIMFAHGFGCDQQVWKRITPYFEEDYQIVLFDYVGSGHADKKVYCVEKYSHPEGYVADILEICEALQLENVIFVGHSISSVIGLLASIEKPPLFQKLCLIGPSPRYLNEEGYNGGFEEEEIDALLDMMEKNYKEWVKYLAPISMKNSERPELTAEFEEVLMANDQTIIRTFCSMTFNIDIRDELCKVTTPSLILQTKEDSIVSVEIGEYLHRQLKNSQFVLMDATGHNPHISYPEETVKYIKEFIS